MSANSWIHVSSSKKYIPVVDLVLAWHVLTNESLLEFLRQFPDITVSRVTWVGDGARLSPLDLLGSVRPPLPPLDAELSLDNIDTLSEKAESLSGLSVRTPET